MAMFALATASDRVYFASLSRDWVRLYGAGHAQSVRVLNGLRLSWITAAVLDAFRDAS